MSRFDAYRNSFPNSCLNRVNSVVARLIQRERDGLSLPRRLGGHPQLVRGPSNAAQN